MKIVIISDIHSNLAALKSVLAALPPVEEIWCLGDIVGYGAEPNECVELLNSQPLPLAAVAGNHDLGVLGSLSLDEFNDHGRAAILWTRPRLTDGNRSLLPAGNIITSPVSDQIALVHGSPRNPAWEYITSTTVAESNFARTDSSLFFFGHTHVPMIYAKRNEEPCRRFIPAPETEISLPALGDRWLVNPGSIGQPRDNDPRASFLVFDTEKMSITRHRVDYDIETTQAKIIEAGLPRILADRLGYGI